MELPKLLGDWARVQEQRDEFRQGLAGGLAELIERDLLPLLNMLVLLLPLVLLGVEFAARSAIAVTLPDTSPDVATLDTPAVPRPDALGAKDHKQAVERRASMASRAPATGPSVLSDSPLGYGE